MKKVLYLSALFLVSIHLSADDGSGSITLNHPMGIWVSAGGTIYVADCFNNRIVQVDDMQGNGLKTYGSSGKTQGKFIHPTMISQDASGLIYVSDYDNDRLVRIENMEGVPSVRGTDPGSSPEMTHLGHALNTYSF